jgi:predicted Zn-dependent protease
MPVPGAVLAAVPLALAAAASPILAQSGAIQSGRAQPITAQERRQGAENDAGIKAQYGGPMSGRLANYVEQVGRRIAVQSGLSGAAGDFNVTLLDSSVDNAFALPGGYVYVTRDLVALMNDEAELAAVMGHEVAHVAARHSRSRQNRATRNSILGVLGQLGVGAIFGNSGLAGAIGRNVPTLTQLDTLGFSRSQETQADDLGIQYLSSAGYHPGALATMLTSLSQQTLLAGGGASAPAWASTHPEPAARVRRAEAAGARAAGVARARNRDVFLDAIDGMMYDEDPRQGVIAGRRFLHTELGVGFEAPAGYTMQNGAAAVTVSGHGGQASFAAAPFSGNLDAYFEAVLSSLGAREASGAQRTTVNGLPAVYSVVRAASGNTPVDVTVFAYQLSPSRAVHFTTVAAAGSGAGPFAPMLASVRRVRADETSARTRYLRVVTARGGETAATFAARMAYPDRQLERFLVLNRLFTNARFAPGQRVKIVTY